jgi:protein TonB
MAILRMAPAPARRLSLPWALTAYSALGASTWYGAQAVRAAEAGKVTTTIEIPLDPVTDRPAPPPEAVAPVAPATPAVVLHALAVETHPPLVEVTVPPDDVPTVLPTVDHGADGLHAGTLTSGPTGQPEIVGRPATPTIVGQGEGSVSRVFQVDFQQMVVLRQVEPVFPAICRLARVQGQVVVLLTVGPDGVPVSARTVSSVHPGFNGESERVALQWRFKPAMENGVPVTSQFHLTFNYRLR